MGTRAFKRIPTMAVAALGLSAGAASASINYSLTAATTNVANWSYGAAVDTMKDGRPVTSGGNLDQKRIDLGHQGDSDGDILRMAQTFQVSSTFTADKINLLVWNVVPNAPIHFRLFQVDDVTSTTYPLNPANVLLTGTYTNADSSTQFGQYILTLDLTGSDEITLNATSGKAGYALEMYTDAITASGNVQWEATVSNTEPNGLPLKYFSNGTSAVYSASRDYSLAITAVPEPASMGFLLAGGLLLARRVRVTSNR